MTVGGGVYLHDCGGYSLAVTALGVYLYDCGGSTCMTVGGLPA